MASTGDCTPAGAVTALRAGVGALDSSRYTFSDGLLEGRRLWLSGQTASDYNAAARKVTVRGDAEQQSHTIYRKIGGVLDRAGMSLADLSHITQYIPVPSRDQLPAITDARTRLLSPDRLTVSTCIVDGLLRRGAHLEVEGEALRGAEAGRAGLLPQALATVLPIDTDGEVVYPGDAASQLQWCVEQAANGAELRADALATAVVTYRADTACPSFPAPAGRQRSASCAVSYRAASGLAHPDILVSLDATAVPAGRASYRRLEVSPGVAASVMQVEDLVFVQGLSSDEAAGLASADVREQASAVYSALTDFLTRFARGATVLRTVESVTVGAVGQYRAVGEVRREFLQEPWPVASGLIYAALPGPGVSFQVDAIAVTTSEPVSVAFGGR